MFSGSDSQDLATLSAFKQPLDESEFANILPNAQSDIRDQKKLDEHHARLAFDKIDNRLLNTNIQPQDVVELVCKHPHSSALIDRAFKKPRSDKRYKFTATQIITMATASPLVKQKILQDSDLSLEIAANATLTQLESLQDKNFYLGQLCMSIPYIYDRLNTTELKEFSKQSASHALEIIDKHLLNTNIEPKDVAEFVCKHPNSIALVDRAFKKPWFGKNYTFTDTQLINMAVASTLVRDKILNDRNLCLKIVTTTDQTQLEVLQKAAPAFLTAIFNKAKKTPFIKDISQTDTKPQPTKSQSPEPHQSQHSKELHTIFTIQEEDKSQEQNNQQPKNIRSNDSLERKNDHVQSLQENVPANAPPKHSPQIILLRPVTTLKTEKHLQNPKSAIVIKDVKRSPEEINRAASNLGHFSKNETSYTSTMKSLLKHQKVPGKPLSFGTTLGLYALKSAGHNMKNGTKDKNRPELCPSPQQYKAETNPPAANKASLRTK